MGNTPLEWLTLAEDYDRIRSLMERSLVGFDDYNTRQAAKRICTPNPPRDDQMFDTPDGRAQFTPHDLPAMEVQSDQYVMMTLRSHDQYNTTIYGLHDRYRGIHGHRRVVLMNAEDMVDRGWKA